MADHAVSNLFADGDTDPRLLPVIHPLHVHNQKLIGIGFPYLVNLLKFAVLLN